MTTFYNYSIEALKVFESSHFSEFGTGHNPLVKFGAFVVVIVVLVLVFSILRGFRK